MTKARKKQNPISDYSNKQQFPSCGIQILRVFSNLNDSGIQLWIITENYLWAKEGSRKYFEAEGCADERLAARGMQLCGYPPKQAATTLWALLQQVK